jgi:hypothetical protein
VVRQQRKRYPLLFSRKAYEKAQMQAQHQSPGKVAAAAGSAGEMGNGLQAAALPSSPQQ